MTEPKGYDHDAEAARQESAPIKIGGQTFHPRRVDWDTTAELRRLGRRQARAFKRQEVLEERFDELDIEADGSELEAEIDAAADDAQQAVYATLACLMRTEAGEPVDVEHLKAHLDIQAVGKLTRQLSTLEPDPTPTTPTSST